VKPRRHYLGRAALLFTLLLLAGCAQPPLASAPQETDAPVWRGRLALRVDSEPPQSFFAAFELRGQAHAGELQLFSPLGSTLARLQWSPGSARLHNNGETRQFDSLDALATQATGAAIPLAALFAWLAGQPVRSEGWEADLTQLNEGRLLARRSTPAPTSELRLILEP
jgi:outer membrane lipoprotein LolB